MILRVIDKKGNVLFERKKGGKKPQYELKYDEFIKLFTKENRKDKSNVYSVKDRL